MTMAAGVSLALAGCAQSGGPATTSSPGSPASAITTSCRAQRFQPDGQGGSALTAVQFVSPQLGWVVGLSQILATSDGGRHWRVHASGKLRLSSVDFVDAQRGWAVGASTVLATSDGGQRWTALPEPCPLIRQVSFVSPLVGFAIADRTLAPDLGGVVLAMTDGGHEGVGLTGAVLGVITRKLRANEVLAT